MPTKTSGRCIVADPTIYYGEPAFRATYTSWLADVPEQGESGMAWEAIIERRGRTGHGIRAKGLKRLINDSMRTFGNDENNGRGIQK